MKSSAEDTVLTDHFDGDGHWPAQVRVLRVSLEGAIDAGNRATSPPTRNDEKPLTMACYAGLGVGHLRRIQPAAEVVAELTSRLPH